MTFDPAIHHRRSIRLKDYDYSQPGAYFVTVCTHGRECALGEVLDDAVILNYSGLIVQECWEQLPDHYFHVDLDAFVVMPNHVRGIIVFNDRHIVGAGLRPAPTWTKRHGLPEIVRAFKAFSSRRINESRQRPGGPVWQRGYYEHVIRNDRSWEAIREYIESNPSRWEHDPDNPCNRLL